MARAPDFWCWAAGVGQPGSPVQKQEALLQALRWYRRGYKLNHDVFPAINLSTLLVLQGERGAREELDVSSPWP